ncbi:MAG: hypothetical protein ACM3WV_00880 [Bacillota bacterium]
MHGNLAKNFIKTAGKYLAVGAGYFLTWIILEYLGVSLGMIDTGIARGFTDLLWRALVPGILLAVLLGTLASRLPVSFRRHMLVWGCIIWLNNTAILVKGKYYWPDLAAGNIWWMIFLQAAAACVTAGLLAKLFGPRDTVQVGSIRQNRSFFGWIIRFAAGAGSYLLLSMFFAFTAVQATAGLPSSGPGGGLFGQGLIVEAVDGVLAAASLLPFILTMRTTKWELAFTCAFILAVIGSLIPYAFQAQILPWIKLENFWIGVARNFCTGLVAASLLRNRLVMRY